MSHWTTNHISDYHQFHTNTQLLQRPILCVIRMTYWFQVLYYNAAQGTSAIRRSGATDLRNISFSISIYLQDRCHIRRSDLFYCMPDELCEIIIIGIFFDPVCYIPWKWNVMPDVLRNINRTSYICIIVISMNVFFIQSLLQCPFQIERKHINQKVKDFFSGCWMLKIE